MLNITEIYPIFWFAIFIFAFILTPLARTLATRHQIIDKPGKDSLKIHNVPIPLCGGLVIILCLLISFVLLFILGRVNPQEISFFSYMIICSFFIFSTGFWDDIKDINPIARLGIYAVIALFIVTAGIKLEIVPFNFFNILLTLFYIIGAINAFNVIDGMDGLCVGLSIIACLGFFMIGLMKGDALLIVMSSILTLSLLGVLPYNFYPARIFIGNAGSSLLGFLLGVMTVRATPSFPGYFDFFLPIFFVFIPIFDMAFAIIRRIIFNKPIFSGDRDHIYDLLLKRGWSQPKVWAALCGVQVLFVLAGLQILETVIKPC